MCYILLEYISIIFVCHKHMNKGLVEPEFYFIIYYIMNTILQIITDNKS